jgi:hypothetical protein
MEMYSTLAINPEMRRLQTRPASLSRGRHMDMGEIVQAIRQPL